MKIYSLWYCTTDGAFHHWTSSLRDAEKHRAQLIREGITNREATAIDMIELPPTRGAIIAALNIYAHAANG